MVQYGGVEWKIKTAFALVKGRIDFKLKHKNN